MTATKTIDCGILDFRADQRLLLGGGTGPRSLLSINEVVVEVGDRELAVVSGSSGEIVGDGVAYDVIVEEAWAAPQTPCGMYSNERALDLAIVRR